MSYQSTDTISAQSSWAPPSEQSQLNELQSAFEALRRRIGQMEPQTERRAPLHEQLARYHGDATPMGAAYRLWKHLESKTTHGMRLVDAMQELVNDEALLTVVATAAPTQAPHAVYTMDAGVLVQSPALSARKPWSLVAQAADALSANYNSYPEIIRSTLAPGVIAMSTKMLTPPAKCTGTTVHVVSNHTEVNADYQTGANALVAPHYKLVVATPELPAGLPIGTATTCNESVPRSMSANVVSMTDGKVKRRTILLDSIPNWEYTDSAKMALLSHVYTMLSNATRQTGDSHSETAAAALHLGIVQRAAATSRVAAVQPTLSRL